MIRKLRRRIAAMTMVTMVLVLTVILLLGYYAAYKTCERMVDMALEDVAGSVVGRSEVEVGEGFFARGIAVERNDLLAVVDMPIHAVALDEKAHVVSVDCLTKNSELKEEALAGILQSAKTDNHGRWQDYQYVEEENESGVIIIIAEEASNLWHRLRGQMVRITVVSTPPVHLMLALISWLFAGLVVRPAKESLKKQKRFLADAGHELKTPLAAISINAAALEAEVGRSSHLDCIRYESDRMSGLVRRMVEAAYMEEPKEIVFSQLDLTSLVEQAALSYESVAMEKQIRYEFQIQDEVQISSDAERIRQLAAILLDNAFKYVDEGGKVSVSLSTEGNRTVFSVGNSGPGIPKDECPYIFERFYRVDKSRSQNGSYGLGLAIAGNLARELKGKITVESEPGVWTRFCLII